MIHIDAMGDPCPIPVVKTKNAIRGMNGSGVVLIDVDNEIAVQNLTKMAVQKGYGVSGTKLADDHFQVKMVVGGAEAEAQPEPEACRPDVRSSRVVAVSSDKMGEGDEALGRLLMKSFIFALTQQEVLPEAIIFYNGGARLTCAEGPILEDLRTLEAQGVEIITCGTCLNHYGLTEQLKIGSVTNMYEIAERLLRADSVVKP